MDHNAIEASLKRIERSVEELKTLTQGEGASVLDGGIDFSGVWQGKVMEDDTYEVSMQLHQTGSALSGSVAIFYDNDEDPYFALQQVAGSVDGGSVRVFGTSVTFLPADPDADYGLDVFEMTASANGRELTGLWTDVDGDANGRVVMRRPIEL